MDYMYNHKFLQQFMEENNLRRTDLLEALGTKDYASLRKWIDGLVPIHILAMLRICNYYQISVSNFFLDEDGLPTDFVAFAPDKDFQPIEIPESVKNRINPKVTGRVSTSIEQAEAIAEAMKRLERQMKAREEILADPEGSNDLIGNALELIRENRCKNNPNPINQDANAEPENAGTENGSSPEVVLKLQLEHQKELRQLEAEFRKREDEFRASAQRTLEHERDRLLSIIEQLNNEISLANRRLEQAKIPIDYSGMVSESEHPLLKDMNAINKR